MIQFLAGLLVFPVLYFVYGSFKALVYYRRAEVDKPPGCLGLMAMMLMGLFGGLVSVKALLSFLSKPDDDVAV